MKLPDFPIKAMDAGDFVKRTEEEIPRLQTCMSGDKGDPIAMMLFISDTDEVTVCGLPEFGEQKNTKERQRFLRSVGTMAGENGERVQMMLSAFMVWVDYCDKNEKPFSAAESPNRKEALVITSSTICGKMSHTVILTGRNQFSPEKEPLQLEGKSFSTKYSSIVGMTEETMTNEQTQDLLTASWWSGFLNSYQEKGK